MTYTPYPEDHPASRIRNARRLPHWTPETVTTVYSPDDLYPRTYPLPSHYMYDMLASEADKWAVLSTIGITREEHGEEGRGPLVAWRNAVADHNGVPRASLDPEQGGVLDLGFTRTATRKFVFYLA